MDTAKQTLRKYFHGLTDEQFEEDVNQYPLNTVIPAMKEYASQACKRQRRMCHHGWADAERHEESEAEAILTAPEPELL